MEHGFISWQYVQHTNDCSLEYLTSTSASYLRTSTNHIHNSLSYSIITKSQWSIPTMVVVVQHSTGSPRYDQEVGDRRKETQLGRKETRR